MSRLSFSDVGAQLAAFATTGDIQRPLITVAGTMDALLPIDHHARAYARKVAAVAEGNDHDQGNGNDRGHGNGGDKHQPAYRLYEVQNGNHIETFQDTFPQLELIEPHAQRAFDLLVGRSSAARRCRPTSAFRAAARSPTRLRSRDTAQIFSCPEGAEPRQSGVGSALRTRLQIKNVSPAIAQGRRIFSLRRWRITDPASCKPPFRRRPSARDGVS